MNSQLQKLLESFTGTGSEAERRAVRLLQTSLHSNFPAQMLEIYRAATRYQVRLCCVFYSLPYCRWSADTLQLGIDATRDKSKFVRYRAYELLAYSQKEEAAKYINALIAAISKEEIKDEDLKACHLALSRKNFNCFMDRTCSGMVFPRWTEILADGSQREIKESKPCSNASNPQSGDQ